MSGYDAPIEDAQFDVLNRGPFAQGIARLAADTPPGWGVRIGVYGRWGDGKSSVLKMVAGQLRGEGHLVAEFNPWGCTTPQEMIEMLADVVISVTKRESRQVRGAATRGIKKSGKLVAKIGEAIGGDLGKVLSPWLDRWAKERSSDVASVVAGLEKHERLIILVDDVDRVDPRLLPRLFFALNDVFALPGISFVLALDPEVVGAALTEYHAGFKTGVEFLAKIVQFPRWLPEPSVDALHQLAEHDRASFAPFIRQEVLAQRADLLPKNPRELRAFIRGLFCLAPEVARHATDEIDQHLVVILEAVRQVSPMFLAALLERDDLLNRRFAAKARGEDLSKSEKDLRQLAKALVPEAEERAVRLALSLCGESHWSADNIRYHAYLAERPHAVTRHEAGSLIDCSTDAERSTWVTEHSGKRGVPTTAVLKEAFSYTVSTYANESYRATTISTEAGNRTRVQIADRLLDFLEWWWFRCDGTLDIRAPKNFLRVFQTFRARANFTSNEIDKKQRAREQDIMLRMAREAAPPLDYLEVLAPWDDERRLQRGTSMTSAVLAEIEERATADVLVAFQQPSGIRGSLLGARIADQYLLLRASMWTSERRAALGAIVSTQSEVVADNCRLFIEALIDPVSYRLRVDLTSIRKDSDLLRTVWAGATNAAVQARFFAKMDELRQQLETILEVPLPLPAWWERVEAAVSADGHEQGLPADTDNGSIEAFDEDM